MRVCRCLSSHELNLYKKGKTIRPIIDCSGSDVNSMSKPSVCFFPCNDELFNRSWEKGITDEQFALEIIEERLGWCKGGGYLVIFEINSKRLQEGTGLYSGKPVTEYYASFYNKKTAKLVEVKRYSPMDRC